MKEAPMVFAFPDYQYLLNAVQHTCQVEEGSFSIEHFSNKELRLTLTSHVAERVCIVLGTITPPEVRLVSFLALCHTLKKEGAKKVIALLPYLAYSRHDRMEPGKSHIAALVGKLFAASGVDEVITLDVHSDLLKELFPMPLTSLSPATLFAEEIRQEGFLNATIVSPDKGAVRRAKEVASLVHGNDEIAFITKKRDEKGITHFELQGKVQEKVVIIDDILDTGKTLVSCCKKLLEQNVKEIIIMVTHGIFTHEAWKELWKLKVKRIYCVETSPLLETFKNEKNILILPIRPLFKNIFLS